MNEQEGQIKTVRLHLFKMGKKKKKNPVRSEYSCTYVFKQTGKMKSFGDNPDLHWAAALVRMVEPMAVNA